MGKETLPKSAVPEGPKLPPSAETSDQLAKTLERDKGMQQLREKYMDAINKLHAALLTKVIEGKGLEDFQRQILADEIEGFIGQASASLEVDEGSRTIKMKTSKKIAGIFKLEVDHEAAARSEEEVTKRMPKLRFKVDIIPLTRDGKESEKGGMVADVAVLDDDNTLVAFYQPGLESEAKTLLYPADPNLIKEVQQEVAEAEAMVAKKSKSVPPYLRRFPPPIKRKRITLNDLVGDLFKKLGMKGGAMGGEEGKKPWGYWNVDFYAAAPPIQKRGMPPAGGPSFNIQFRLRM